MAKNAKVKKNRTYKIQKLGGVPSLNIRGKFLEKLGVEIGSCWELIEGTDMITFKKVPQLVTDYNNAISQLNQSKKAMMVCESRVQYLATQISGGNA